MCIVTPAVATVRSAAGFILYIHMRLLELKTVVATVRSAADLN